MQSPISELSKSKADAPNVAKVPNASDATSQSLTLKVIDLTRGGAGLARDEQGRVVFVPYSAPGDVVRVRITEAKKNYAQAELIEVEEPSPDRQTPPCPVFGKCGGCQWQHLPYELQWRTKVQGVIHALARAQIERPSELGELPAERIWEYRNRIQLRGFHDQLGFLAAGTNESVSVNGCAIARPEINAVWEQTREEGRRLPRPYKVEIEVMPDGSIRKSWNSGHGAQGFRQVHDEQNEKLKAWVGQAITAGGGLLDLFGGSGNLSWGLKDQMSCIECVDTGAPRVDAPPQPANRPRTGYSFHRQGVGGWITQRAAQSPVPRYNSAIIDPPREGLAADFSLIAPALEKLGVKELVAVGCDPDAWARDVSRFVKRGWRLDRAAVLDLFPQTAHVESLARLVRD